MCMYMYRKYMYVYININSKNMYGLAQSKYSPKLAVYKGI